MLKVESTDDGSADDGTTDDGSTDDENTELEKVGSTLASDETEPMEEERLPELIAVEVEAGNSLLETDTVILLLTAGIEVDWLEKIGAVLVIDSDPTLDVATAEDVALLEGGTVGQ